MDIRNDKHNVIHKKRRLFVEYYNGQVWPSRIFGFVIGLVVFSLMSYFLFNEKISLKTAICLGLCIVITLVQLLWKNKN